MQFQSTTQTISWFRDRYLEGTLTLRPSYQRNAVWMERQKNWLVETILKKMPVPEVFVQITTNEEGDSEYAVVDGQQRIRSLLQFVGADSDEAQIEFDRFVLDKLPAESAWYGRAFEELPAQEKKDYFRYQLAVRYLESEDEDEIKEMFRRLNRFTSPLKPQELRNATYGGPFAQLAVKLADDHGDYLAENRIITADAIRRMSDVEFMAELMIGVMHGPQGGQPSVIDNYYQQYEDYEDEFPKERLVRKWLTKSLALLDQIVPELKPSRWSNKSDYYSLVVAIAGALKSSELDEADVAPARTRLARLESDILARIEDDEVEVSDDAVEYVRNVIRGANDKARRAARHAVLLRTLTGGSRPIVNP
ncbi:hypothetical protein ASF83_02080 [Plantibacter sp. Leaf171]|uniref:GmrSD restriction endonuclease domain-containing protein n=1 Tax=unclassified Plantibacter TaxID=2624265 RepID=UPI0006F8B2D8|nr:MULTISPECIES: DUF262 domain-containing protein [unclassified Plantibacter]KQM17888.1 hypothetical protein ASE44_02095 [Plantibacter sp. Leaf1]KQR60669.1 hypothetical protein ASF83_02080 [Plantibacter sp. Leaf171]